MRKWGVFGVVVFLAESGMKAGVVFGRGECLHLEQGLSQVVREFASAIQDECEGIEIGLVIGSRVGKEIFGGQKVVESLEKLGEKRPVDLAEKVGIGKEFKFGGVHKRV